jgi:hypothetical protein
LYILQLSTSGWAAIASDRLPFESGVGYVASGFIKTVSAHSKAFIKVEYFDPSNNWLGQTFSYGLSGTHDWTWVHVVADNPPADTTQIRVVIGLNGADTGTAYKKGSK